MGTASVEGHNSRSLSTSLVSAVLEWLLIFMLLVDSIFSFFITRCARFWKLTTPCLLCSRLDHIFGAEKKGYLWNLICGDHKLEISSLVFCHAHNKLVNVHGMCESCLFSFATTNKSNAETYRLLVGKLEDKLEEDPYLDIDGDPLLGDQKTNTSTKRHCSCCNEPCVSREVVRKLIQTKSSGLEVAEVDVPLSSSVVHCKEDIEKSSNKQSMLFSTTHPNLSDGDNHLSHVQYTELKITSDTESDGNGSNLDVETTNNKEYLTIQGVHMEPNFISLAGNLTSTKLIEPASAPEPLVLEPLVQLGNTQLPVVYSVPIGHGLDELNPKQAETNGDCPSLADLISLDNMLPSSNTMEISVEVLEEIYVTRSEAPETECKKTEKGGSMRTQTSEAGSEAQPVSSDAAQMAPNALELGDAYKLAVSNRGKQLSGKLSEQWIGKDSSRVSEDLKLLLSQLSFSRMNDQSRDMSPRLSVNSDEQKNFDASSVAGLQILQKRISLERNESGLESIDGSIVSEIEGENVVDRLKRQIEHDKKIMSCLYKELEEERNASAIAANQAMAMITRLQEEKATLHMEALQCLRMMEEQTEYDDDALQKANDLIAEKDKEIQDLEAELEFYRMNFSNELTMDNVLETSDVKERDIGVVHLESNRIEPVHYGTPVASKPNIHEKVGGEGDNDVITYNNSLLEFEDEKLNIMQNLKKLEKMLLLFSNNGMPLDLANGEYFGNSGSFSSGPNDLNSDSRKLEDGEHNTCLPRRDPTTEDHPPSFENPPSIKESSELDCSDRNSSLRTEMTDFSSLRSEMSHLNKRIEALEADKNFLEHTINSLRSGEEGLHFVQEIASHLRELRKIGIRS